MLSCTPVRSRTTKRKKGCPLAISQQVKIRSVSMPLILHVPLNQCLVYTNGWGRPRTTVVPPPRTKSGPNFQLAKYVSNLHFVRTMNYSLRMRVSTPVSDLPQNTRVLSLLIYTPMDMNTPQNLYFLLFLLAHSSKYFTSIFYLLDQQYPGLQEFWNHT